MGLEKEAEIEIFANGIGADIDTPLLGGANYPARKKVHIPSAGLNAGNNP